MYEVNDIINNYLTYELQNNVAERANDIEGITSDVD